MDEFDVAMVGGGNMGAALLQGMIASKVFDPSTLVVIETIGARRAELTTLVPGVTVAAEMVPCASAVIAVKPDGATDAVRAAVRSGARRVLSIAAGIRTSSLDDAAGPGVATVRAMPNTPALVGLGAAAIAPGATAGDDDLAWAERILGSVGIVERLDESLLDAFTGVAGSGPAYVFRFAEVLADAAVAQGIDPAAAERVVAQLLLGASTLLARDGNPGQLRTNVTSPGGTTAAGLDRMNALGFAELVDATVRAATERSRDLG
jgi:pyrroline-5-carboxylate reductase